MCEPTTLFAIGAGLSLAQGVASYASASSAANAQEKQNRAQAKNIREATFANYDQLELRRQQEEEAAGQNLTENQIEALKATETAQVAAGEAGVSGLSVDALLRDLYGQEARYRDSVQTNLDYTTQDISHQKDNVHRSGVSQVNSLQPVQRPSFLGAALKTGTGIYGAYNTHLKV